MSEIVEQLRSISKRFQDQIGCDNLLSAAAREIEMLDISLQSSGDQVRAQHREIENLKAERDRLLAERDEARRKVCWLLRSWAKTERDCASERGWDCFRQEDGT